LCLRVLRLAIYLERVATPLVASALEEDRTGPLIATRLSYCVDVTCGEAAVSHVKRREFR
jgi:hypothetical protein